jgi:hypothetical protein
MRKIIFAGMLCAFLFSCNSSADEFENINVGDSLFVKSEYTDIYKKARITYRYYGSRDKFAPKDTIDFYNVNGVISDFFIEKRTSFIGIAKGKDTTVSNPASKDNDKWIIIEPNPALIEWYNAKNERWKWNDGTSYTSSEISIGDDNLYVMSKNVTLVNNDEKMRPPQKK